jgi:hypothetical protein
MLSPNLEVIIQRDHVTVRNLETGRTTSVAAPFSCEHLLVDDSDIFEHASYLAIKEVVASSFWSFPRVTILAPGRQLHNIEQKVIRDAMRNAGARRVAFHESVQRLDEQAPSRAAYIESAKRKR